MPQFKRPPIARGCAFTATTLANKTNDKSTFFILIFYLYLKLNRIYSAQKSCQLILLQKMSLKQKTQTR
jgi:hypothetical protein